MGQAGVDVLGVAVVQRSAERAVMLGLGRAMGETIAVALVIGSAPQVTANVFSSGDGTTKVVSVKVGGVEQVVVPAGTIAAYRLELTGMQLPLVMHISQQGPRRIVRIAPTGTPLVFELVK